MNAARRGGTAKADTRGNIRKAHLWKKPAGQVGGLFVFWVLDARRRRCVLALASAWRTFTAPNRRPSAITNVSPVTILMRVPCALHQRSVAKNSNDYLVFGMRQATPARGARGTSPSGRPSL
jgi:hypothetical protein